MPVDYQKPPSHVPCGTCGTLMPLEWGEMDVIRLGKGICPSCQSGVISAMGEPEYLNEFWSMVGEIPGGVFRRVQYSDTAH